MNPLGARRARRPPSDRAKPKIILEETSMEKVGIGIIGCGNISSAYLTAMKSFPILDIRGVADLNRELAEAKAAEFGLKAVDVAALFADPKVEIVVNLTIPKGHVAVGLQALDAGKHTY